MELKPCPFCGGEAEMTSLLNDFGEIKFHVFCKNCPCELGNDDCCCAEDVLPDYAFESAEQAVNAWNMRK